MIDSFAQRLVLLGAVAVLAGALALAAVEGLEADSGTRLTGAAAPSGWYIAFAGSRGPAGDAQQTTCGQILSSESLGITHPVLPCGTKIYVRFGEQEVLTEVVDRGTGAPGRVFDVTQPLARRLGLADVQTVHWRFAR